MRGRERPNGTEMKGPEAGQGERCRLVPPTLSVRHRGESRPDRGQVPGPTAWSGLSPSLAPAVCCQEAPMRAEEARMDFPPFL